MVNQNSSSITNKWTTGTLYITKEGLEDMGKSFKEALSDYHSKALRALQMEVDHNRLPPPDKDQKFHIRTEFWYE